MEIQLNNTLAGRFEAVQQALDKKKPTVIWMGISAGNLAEQSKFQDRLDLLFKKLRQNPNDQKTRQTVENEIKNHVTKKEHLQHGYHLDSAVESLLTLCQRLNENSHQLDQFVFCHTSALHRYNRQWVPQLASLTLEDASEKAYDLFEKPWLDAHRNKLTDHFKKAGLEQVLRFDSWRNWYQGEIPKQFIQVTNDYYQENENFKTVVHRATLQRLNQLNQTLKVEALKLINSEEPSHKEAIQYILEECARVWYLLEEFKSYNVILVYPSGDLPPAVKQLLEDKNLLNNLKQKSKAESESRKQNSLIFLGFSYKPKSKPKPLEIPSQALVQRDFNGEFKDQLTASLQQAFGQFAAESAQTINKKLTGLEKNVDGRLASIEAMLKTLGNQEKTGVKNKTGKSVNTNDSQSMPTQQSIARALAEDLPLTPEALKALAAQVLAGQISPTTKVVQALAQQVSPEILMDLLESSTSRYQAQESEQDLPLPPLAAIKKPTFTNTTFINNEAETEPTIPQRQRFWDTPTAINTAASSALSTPTATTPSPRIIDFVTGALANSFPGTKELALNTTTDEAPTKNSRSSTKTFGDRVKGVLGKKPVLIGTPPISNIRSAQDKLQEIPGVKNQIEAKVRKFWF